MSSAASSPPLASGTVLTHHDYFVTVFIELNILLSMSRSGGHSRAWCRVGVSGAASYLTLEDSGSV